VWEALGGNNSKMYMFFKDHTSLKKKKKDHLPSKIILFIEILCFLSPYPLLTQKQNLEHPLQTTIKFKPPSFPYFQSSTTLTPLYPPYQLQMTCSFATYFDKEKKKQIHKLNKFIWMNGMRNNEIIYYGLISFDIRVICVILALFVHPAFFKLIHLI
jgi:hypothetical protein